MKAVSFNVNSVRMRLHQLQKLVDNHQPDIIGLQETKVTDQDFPLEAIEQLGYHVAFSGQKTHYGVALLSKHPMSNIQKGYAQDEDDAQRRFIAADIEIEGKNISVINGYFPQGESRDHPTKFPAKQRFYQDLMQHLNDNHTPDDHLIVMGDMNISHQDIDIGIGEDNRKRWLRTGKCSFLPEEREWMETLLDWGLIDTYRQIHPERHDIYSWFDYRSRGFEREPKRGLRIDMVLASQPLASCCIHADIDYDVRAMEKPSDHCPIYAEFSL